MGIGCRWHAKFLFISSVLLHVMDDVEFIPRTCCRLLDAAEVGDMAETRHARPVFCVPDVASPKAEAEESSIKNTLDVGVVFLARVFGRVQIESSGYLRVQDDKDAALAAQNKLTSN